MAFAGTINLVKGGNVSLQGLSNIVVGLGWDPNNEQGGSTFDLDAAAFLLGANDKMRTSKDFIFFNNLTSACGSVVHLGDSLDGDGEGDDEQIQTNLKTMPADVQKMVICVAIYDAANRRQNFGQVDNSYVRVVDMETGNEHCKYELQEDFSTVDTIIVGEVYKRNNEWKFRAVGKGYVGGFAALLKMYS